MLERPLRRSPRLATPDGTASNEWIPSVFAVKLDTEAIEAWWLPWSSKPVAREQRAVGSIPIRFRHFHARETNRKLHRVEVYFRNFPIRSAQFFGN